MRISPVKMAALCLMVLVVPARAVIRYVNLNNPVSVAPFNSWSTAATNIQQAIDVAFNGDEIVVTNGIYRTGGGLYELSSVTNRVSLNKPVTVRSVNGPAVTVIEGDLTPEAPVRCAYVTNGAALIGFTLTNGFARSPSAEPWYTDTDGGGVFCESTNASVANCIISHCVAQFAGGGAYSGTLRNCWLNGNSASSGGGAAQATLINCTVNGNTATVGGGMEAGAAHNSIVYFNTATLRFADYELATFDHCITTPLPPGSGNLDVDPQFTDWAHVSGTSPARGAGIFALTAGTDVDGEAWLNPPAIGCDEFYAGVITGPLAVTVQAPATNVVPGFDLTFTGTVSGHASATVWDFGDGNVASNRLSAVHRWVSPGIFPVVYRAYNDSNPGGVSATVMVQVVTQPVYYVARSNATPLAPYNSWATAATNIQDAVNAANTVGALVLVSNGLYEAGGKFVNGASNRVAITLPLVLQSVNGPATTIVDGGAAAGCVYLAAGGIVTGFTLTNGAAANMGGGVLGENRSAVVSNCVIIANSSGNQGGGAGFGTLYDCTLQSNFAPWGGGGAYAAKLIRCTVNGNSSWDSGGGVALGSLLNCSVATNNAFWGAGLTDCSATNCTIAYNGGIGGGGANNSVLVNCFVISNTAAWYGGGGMRQSRALDCTLIGNSADFGGGAAGGSLWRCTLNGNSAGDTGGGANSAALTNCSLAGNWVNNNGGGVENCTVYNSALTRNSATNSGGGANNSTLVNCTVTLNTATFGGGVAACNLSNAICYYNVTPAAAANHGGSTFNFSCTTPWPVTGAGNIASAPELSDGVHLSAASPCRAAGNAAFATGTDRDGEAWLLPPSMGCDEFYSGTVTGALGVTVTASYTNVAKDFVVTFGSQISGRASVSVWNLGGGNTISNQTTAVGSWAAPGDYPVTLTAFNDSNPGGVSATVTVHVVAQPVHYVARNNVTPLAPYTSWATAATNLQDAVDAATVIGALVRVTNGVYDTGGRDFADASNRVAVTLPLVLASVNGPEATQIKGNGAARGVYLCTGASLRDFTVTNGFCGGGSGGGIRCQSTTVLVSNCVLVGNLSYSDGGGAYRGTFSHCSFVTNSSDTWFGARGGAADFAVFEACTLTGNSAFYGGGASRSVLRDCSLTGNSAGYGGGVIESVLANCTLTGNSAGNGGGAQASTLDGCALVGNFGGTGAGANGSSLNRCTLKGNWTSDAGGGANGSTLLSCALSGNTATNWGGGVNASTLIQCTLVDNSSLTGGGGANESTLMNCILFYNTAPTGGNFLNATQSFCCTTPLPGGAGNFTTEPQLVDVAHIAATSPCRGAGSAGFAVGADLDGEPWVNPPSIGCDEYVSGSITGALGVVIQTSYTNLATGFELGLSAQISGHAAATRWDFGDGTVVSNLLHLTHAWSVAGDYLVELRAFNETFPAGISATVAVHVVAQPIHYVSLSSVTPVAPYLSWATAATNLQQAADGAYAGSTVLASNGVYQSGGRVIGGGLTNRLVVKTPVTVRSLNGPGVTILRGNGVIGTNAVRCAYLEGGVTLSGFTITAGATRDDGDGPTAQSGGGVWCAALSAVVTNCVFTNNWANSEGGGAYGGTLIQCSFRGNAAAYNGGAAAAAALNSCSLTASNFAANAGGGTSGGWVTNCLFTGNVAGYGGAVYNGQIVNCQLFGNRATSDGGAAYGSTIMGCYLSSNTASSTAGAAIYATLMNSAVNGNSANSVGGIYDCSVTNCTIAGNRAVSGTGGAQNSRLYNSILYYNSAPDASNYVSCVINYSCVAPLPPDGVGNFASEPQLADYAHLSATSPCRAAGSSLYVTGRDVDGESWATLPAVGGDEFYTGAITGALSAGVTATFTNVATGFTVYFQSQIGGHAAAHRWDFGDGTIQSNRLWTTHRWNAPGDYAVQFRVFNESNPAGVSTSLVVHVENPLHYVRANNPTPAPPFNSWATAANHIQDAVDAAFAGGTVLVSNGTYAVRVTSVAGANTRVAVTKPLTILSLNGPAVTTISGAPGLRCAYLTNQSVLTGFTLSGASGVDYGAGVFCQAADVVISNCVFSGNTAVVQGGGAYQGTIFNSSFAGNSSGTGGGAMLATLAGCTLNGNSSGGYGGGANSCTLNSCTLNGNLASGGGGAYASTLGRCVVTTNSAGYGGGIYESTAYNSLFLGNSASPSGGAANISSLYSCTLSGNTADHGGGVFQCTLFNSILYLNNAGDGLDAIWSGLYSCTTDDPKFVNAAAGNFRLQTNSPAINAGSNPDVIGAVDLDGLRRIAGGTVDLGAYEFLPPDLIALTQWLQQYGLPVDGSADALDADSDGMSNFNEWRADTNPTNALSGLRLVGVTNGPSGASVTWQSTATRSYWLERATNLGAAQPFRVIGTNLVGVGGTQTYLDTSATNSGPYLYRIGVQ